MYYSYSKMLLLLHTTKHKVPNLFKICDQEQRTEYDGIFSTFFRLYTFGLSIFKFFNKKASLLGPRG